MPETDSRAVPTTGWAQTGAPPMRRLAATSDSISVRPQINPICSATTAENTRSTAVSIRRLGARSPGTSRLLSVMRPVSCRHPAVANSPSRERQAHALAACATSFRVVCDAGDQAQ